MIEDIHPRFSEIKGCPFRTRKKCTKCQQPKLTENRFPFYINTKKDMLEYLETEGPHKKVQLLCRSISIAPPDLIEGWLDELVSENKIIKEWPDTYRMAGGQYEL